MLQKCTDRAETLPTQHHDILARVCDARVLQIVISGQRHHRAQPHQRLQKILKE